MRTKYTKEEGEKVKAGALTLKNVSVKSAGRSLSPLYSEKRIKLLEPFAGMVRDRLLYADTASTMSLASIMRTLRSPNGLQSLTDSEQTLIYNSFGADLKNMLAVASADKRYEDAWKRLITTLDVSNTEIRSQLGRDIRIAFGYSWHTSIFPELLFSPLTVTSTWEYYSREDRDYLQFGLLTMDTKTRRSLCDIFFGEAFRTPQLSQSLPEDRNLKTEDFEQATITDLMTLEGVALSGPMLSSNGSITAAAVKRIRTQTQIPDFTAAAGEWQPDRVELLCLTYFTLLERKSRKGSIDIRELARFALDSMPRLLVGPMFGSFIPHLQGFTKAWTENSYAPSLASVVMKILLETRDEWMDLGNFPMQLLCDETFGPCNNMHLKLFVAQNRDKARLVRKSRKEQAEGSGKQEAEPIDWWQEIGLKFAVHWIKYLCALGLVELAVDPDADDSDPMEGMRFARLTPLGRYSMGVDGSYAPKRPEGAEEVDFDAANGILTIGPKSPYQMFLSNIAKRIGPTRFSISVGSLLKGCRNKAELEQRISNLSVILDPEKHPAIGKMTEEARKHTDCAVRDGGYSLIRLRPDLPGLRELLLGNKELREMAILAGPTLALVKTHKMERFNTICAANGYLMD